LTNPNDPRNVADTVAPVINISSPANNSTVSGNVLVKANATDTVGVKSVTFYRDPNPTIETDDIVLFEDTAGPEWQYNLPTESLANGNHRIKAVARDYKDNKTSFSIVVTVSN
ncbi:MAG TPA: Ig-like domain-containing protein, partial [Flavobacterium sp.]|nr:Ig-like domain-containing protein [Flavobacterium sp.]